MPWYTQVPSPCPAEVPARLSASLHRSPFPEPARLPELLNLTRSSPGCVLLTGLRGNTFQQRAFSEEVGSSAETQPGHSTRM